MIADQGRVKLV